MDLTANMREKVLCAVCESKKEIIGLDELKNEAHAKVFVGIIKAFGENPDGFIYIEANLPKNTYKPADIILCDPDTGVIVIEVKGHSLEMIERVVGGTKFSINFKGHFQEIAPWDQARTVMFDIQNEFRKTFYTTKAPWFSYMIAFPDIDENQWKNKFGDNSIAFNEVIFLKDLENIKTLKSKIINRRIPYGCTNMIQNPIEKERIDKVKMLFGDSAVLYNKKRFFRRVDEFCLGFEIDRLEQLDKYLSKEQQELSDLNIDGKPRLIRGVAGSGKTVVLANMIAKYIKKLKRQGRQSEFDFDCKIDPAIKIAVVCYNKTLVPLLKEKIEISYMNQTGEELKWNDFIWVKNIDSLIYDNFVNKKIINNEIWEIGTTEERSKFLSKEWENYKKNNIKWEEVIKFDAIFIDEGQDLSEVEYGLLYDLLKPSAIGEKNIIIFYDDAQNIYGRNRPNWSEIGINITPDRSSVMRECYRNTKQIINLAYNVLLGSCADEKIKVKTRSYSDINYLKKLNLVKDYGDWIYVDFAKRNGPEPVFKKFKDEEDELNWVVESVKELIEKENVRAEDILILTYTNKYCERLSKKFQNIKSIKKIINAYKKEEKNSFIFEKDALTISTIHSAKGYDASIVFIIGLDDFTDKYNKCDNKEEKHFRYQTECRALFYVGATRAKYLLYLSGVDDHPNLLLKEIEKTHKMLMDKGIYKKI